MPASIRQRNDLALQHLGLAGFVASRLQRQGLDDLDDLMQEAASVFSVVLNDSIGSWA